MAKFSDVQLIQILQKAARRVNRELCLTGTADVIVVSDGGVITTPNNPDFEDLVLLQAECLSTQREYQTELRDADGGVLIRDGEQTTDTRGAGIARGTFFQTDHNPCAEIRRALLVEKFRDTTGRLVW